MNAAPRENWRANGTLNGSAIVVQSNRPCLDWLHTGDSTHQLDLTSLDLMQELPLSHSGRCTNEDVRELFRLRGHLLGMARNASLASDIFLSVCITRRRPPGGRFDANLRRHGASGGGMARWSCWFDAITAGRECKGQENKDEQEWVKAASP
jgi:hypothetical protein